MASVWTCLDMLGICLRSVYGIPPWEIVQPKIHTADVSVKVSEYFTLVMLHKLKKPHPLPIFSQSDYFLQSCCYKFTYLRTNSADPNQKLTDLDLHCLQRQGIFGYSRTRVKIILKGE